MPLNNLPKVSVIVPNYNHAKYLERRIDSILYQTYQDFELIILDDSSKDDSREIIKKYINHSKVKHVIFNEINSGSTFKQWEKGITLCSGEYIWIAESDDWSNPAFLKCMVTLLDYHSDAALAFSQSTYIDENDEILYSGLEGADEIWKNNLVLTSEQALKQFVWHTQIVNASSVVFRKAFYYQIGSNDYLGFKLCGDWMFYILLLENGRLVYEKKELNYFRQHLNNVRSNYDISLEIMERLRIYSYLKLNHNNVIDDNAARKVEEMIKYRIYIKLCMYFRGQKSPKLHLALAKSFSLFPKLIVSLPKLILSNYIKKI